MRLSVPIQIWDYPGGLAVLHLASDYNLGCWAKACIFRPVVVEIMNPELLDFRVACWDHLSHDAGKVIRVFGFTELTNILKETWNHHDVEV